jgi:hypothetical protein
MFFHVKIQLLVTTKSAQNPDPHCFGFLDPDPYCGKKSWINGGLCIVCKCKTAHKQLQNASIPGIKESAAR